MTARRPPQASKRRIDPVKKLLFSLAPLVIVCVSAETVQRIRYYQRTGDARWLTYGITLTSAADLPGPVEIPANLRRRSAPVPDAVIEAAGASAGESTAPGNVEDERPRAGRIIACVGGSSTYGVFNEPSATYPARLGELLNADAPGDGLPVQVLNFGAPGVSSGRYRPLIDEALAQQPDVLLFYTGYNDIFISDVNEGYIRTLAGIVLGGVRRVNAYSLLSLTVTEKFLIWRSNQRRSVIEDGARYRRLEADFRANMTEHVGRLRRLGVRVVLIPEVLMAKRFGVLQNFEDYSEKYARIPVILEATAAVLGAEYVNLQADFDVPDFERYFVDPVHLTDVGNQRLSMLILQKSRTIRNLVEARPPGQPPLLPPAP